MTVKEWAAAYRAANEMEQQERIARLPREPVEESVRSYFSLCRMVLALSGSSDEPAELWETRLKHYKNLMEKWTRLAERQKYADQPRRAASRH